MEYVNLNLSLPENIYLELDGFASKFRMTKNEIILNIILGRLVSEGKGFDHIKNAGFYNRYN